MMPRLTTILALALLLTGCASTAEQSADEVDPATQSTQADREFELPKQVNHTPFTATLLTARDSSGEYYSWSLKIAFDFDANGQPVLSERQEESLVMEDDPTNDFVCGEKGGLWNQRTAWYPYTAILMHGGKLRRVSGPDQDKPLDLLEMSHIEGGGMVVVGNRARKIEYSFAPCVGKQRATSGYRLPSYLPRGATLSIKPDKGSPIDLTFPTPLEPHVLLRYKMGAMIPVPMRPVVVAVDARARRMVVQYQTTFPLQPPLRVIELRAYLPNDTPSPGENPSRYRERTEAMLEDLRRCPVSVRAIEPCATPNRYVDRRIFSF